MDSMDELALEVSIGAGPAVVWECLTERRSEWWPDMHFTAERGARLREEWTTEEGLPDSASGTVTSVARGIGLSFDWHHADWEAPLSVSMVLTPTADGTVVQLRETGFAALRLGDRLHREHSAGWRFHLANLAGCAAGS